MAERFNEYKICFLGEAGVGKTSILSKHVHGKIDADTCATIGASFQVCRMNNADGDQIKLMVWDTAGQERYRSMIQIYTRGCRVFVIVYDLSDPDSFKAIKQFWLEYATKGIDKDGEKCLFFIVGNKSDLVEDHKLLLERIDRGYQYVKSLEDQYYIRYFHTSAKQGTSASDLFKEIVQYIDNYNIKPSLEFKSLLDDNSNSSSNNHSHEGWGTYLYNQAWKCDIL
jgi:Ras-related protein Rab-5C